MTGGIVTRVTAGQFPLIYLERATVQHNTEALRLLRDSVVRGYRAFGPTLTPYASFLEN